MAGKDDGLGIPKPALKSLIDSFKTISETFNDILQKANEEEAEERAKKANGIAASSGNGRAGAKGGSGRVTITPAPRTRRAPGTQLEH